MGQMLRLHNPLIGQSRYAFFAWLFAAIFIWFKLFAKFWP